MGILNNEGLRLFDREEAPGERKGKVAGGGVLPIRTHWKSHLIQMISIRLEKRPTEFLDRKFRNSDQEKENLLLPRHSIGSTWKTQG
jgi:hypothetical protein